MGISTEEINKCIENAERKNKRLKKEIDNLIGIKNPLYSLIWGKINKLIENEVELHIYYD